MFPKSLLTGVIALLTLGSAHAQKTQLTAQFFGGWDFSPTPPTSPLRDQNGVPLLAGTDAPDDGAIFQIGYFTSGGANPDWNSFVPISSTPGSNHLTTIGDEGGAPVDDANGMGGIFSVAITLDVNDPADAAILPPGYPAQLGIRFFNGTSVAGSTHYNTVTLPGGSWDLNAPNNPPDFPAKLNMDLPEAFVWESGPGGQFQTSLTVAPEPSTSLLLLFAGALSLRRRRR